jgi:chromosome segregation ATPase
MSILNKIFGSKSVTITSEAIRGEIARAEGEIVTLHSKLAAARSGIMFLSDSEHQAVEADGAATERAIKRLDARIAHLNDELPRVVAAEEAAQAAAKDDALRQRADAARKANTVESKKLLTEIDKLSCQMGDVLARLNEIADETNSVNKALHNNPVADSIVGFETLYRKHQAGHYELPLSAIVLPPAFSGGTARWPRSS